MLLFFSDIHGSPKSLKTLEKHIERLSPDHLILLGDALYHGPRNPLPEDYDPKETARILNGWKKHLFAVRGNCDADVDQMMLEFPVLSDNGMILAEGKTIFLSHGHKYAPQNLPPLAEGSVFAYGHTHIPQNEIRNGITLFNPGSVTFPKNGNAPSFGLFRNGIFSIELLS